MANLTDFSKGLATEVDPSNSDYWISNPDAAKNYENLGKTKEKSPFDVGVPDSPISDTSGIRNDISDLPSVGGDNNNIPKVNDDSDKTVSDYLKEIQNQEKLTSDEEKQIEAAGESARLQYQPLVDKATEAARQGKASAYIQGGERGGFMSTQFAGIAALKQTQGKTFAGAGGVIENTFSAYDRDVQTLKQQQISAINNAKAAEKEAIISGKREDLKLANQMYKDAQDLSLKIEEAAMKRDQYALDVIKADQDYEIKEKNYNLELQKYLSGETRADTKEKMDKAKLDLDIASITGKYMGADTLEAKKMYADEAFKKLGYDLDVKEFNEMVKNNSFDRFIKQKQLELDQDKANASNAGIDIEGAAQRIFSGNSTMTDELKLMEGKAGQQALKQIINNHANILKQEAKNTGNATYDIMASESSSGNLNATDRQNLDKIFMVASQMGSLKDVFDRLKSSGKAGAIIGKIAKHNWMDKDVAEFKAQLAAIVPTVARGIFGEVGVLTDNDINNYSKAVIGIDNPTEAADAIFNKMLETLENKATTTLKNAAAANNNVSGYAENYQALINSCREMAGKEKLKTSTNVLLYSNIDDMKNKVNSSTWNDFYNILSNQAESNGNTIEDEFNIMQETKRLTDLMAGVSMPKEKEYSSSFNEVGDDTNKVSGKTGSDYLKNYGSITGETGSSYWKWGLDVDLKKGDPVFSPVDGEVVFSGEQGGFGNRVGIKTSKGNIIYLSHLDSLGVKVGDKIKSGQNVGNGGNTGRTIALGGGDGSHLDITVKKPDGSYYTPQEVKKNLS